MRKLSVFLHSTVCFYLKNELVNYSMPMYSNLTGCSIDTTCRIRVGILYQKSGPYLPIVLNNNRNNNSAWVLVATLLTAATTGLSCYAKLENIVRIFFIFNRLVFEIKTHCAFAYCAIRYDLFNQIVLLTPQTLVPSKPRTESSASRGSSNSTKANPGGFLATQTFLNGPYLVNASSISYLEALLPRFPMYTLHDKSHESRCLDMVNYLEKILDYKNFQGLQHSLTRVPSSH